MTVVAIGAMGAAILISREATPATIAAAVAGDGAAAELPVLGSGPAPSVAGAAGWLNTPALDDGDLVGHVVLYDFWTFGCVNCQHTLPQVKAWQERYAGDGLIILSIHTPEFDYEADPGRVAEFVEANGITYPVALDPERAVWRTWDNHYWPAFYLHDPQGRLRLRHVGEGGYEATEDAIRSLLGVEPSSARALVR